MKDNIPGFIGYHVSKTGNVYSRYVRGSRGKLSNDFTLLRPKKRPKYHSVSLYRDGKSTKIFVHRLVAMVYLSNPNNLPIVMHLDNNIYNNHYKNLKWGTYKENTQQMMREGRNRGQFKSTLTKQQISLILEKYSTGKYSQIQLAKLVGLKSQGRISRIINKYQRVRME